MTKKTMKHKSLCIAEWQSFGVEDICEVLRNCQSTKTNEDLKNQAQKIFNELIEFAHAEGNHIFLKFAGKKLKAQNYVGLIQAKSGFCVEILPKTFRTAKKNEGFKIQNCTCKKTQDTTKQPQNMESNPPKCKVCEAKALLLKMLQSLKDSPFKQSHFAHLKLTKMPLLEIFILMFLQELEKLVKKGLKSDYIVCEENRNFLKGKLLFHQNVKFNFAHKERFFTSGDEFSTDSPPNLLIKTTLELLSKVNLSTNTSAKLMQMRFIFVDIPPSQSIDKDLSKCQNLRYFRNYKMILQWCEIFLKRKSFTPYQKDSKAYALFFDMNKLFESFVVSEMKKWLCDMKLSYENKVFMKQIFGENIDASQKHYIKTQEKSKFLAMGEDKDRFQLKPDIVGYKKQKQTQTKEAFFIADTKWKILSKEQQNYGVSQSDMYQIFAYLAKYQCNQGFLIYPKIEDCNDELENLELVFKPQLFTKAIAETNNIKPQVMFCFFSL